MDFFFVTFFLVYTYIFAFFVEVAFFSRFLTFSTVSFKFVLFLDFVLFYSFFSLLFIFSFLIEVECETSSHQVPAELSATHQFSSAHQRSAVRYRALPCDAILCGLYRAVPCCVLCYSFFRTCPGRSQSANYHTAALWYTTPGLYVIRCRITKNALPAQLRSAII